MRLLVIAAVVVVVLLSSSGALALEVSTTVDPETQMVRVDFTNLPPYEQIRLEGTTSLFWCNCADNDNPSSLMSTGFTVSGDTLEVHYEGVPPPSANYITYFYLDGPIFSGLEMIDWIVVTPSSEGDLVVTGDRPLFVPEPSLPLLVLAGMLGLLVIARSPRAV
jgi:hypothetical protein